MLAATLVALARRVAVVRRGALSLATAATRERGILARTSDANDSFVDDERSEPLGVLVDPPDDLFGDDGVFYAESDDSGQSWEVSLPAEVSLLEADAARLRGIQRDHVLLVRGDAALAAIESEIAAVYGTAAVKVGCAS